MKNKILLLAICTLLSNHILGQSIVQKRAKNLGIGTNLSYFDNYWNANKTTKIEKHFGDFANWTETNKRKARLTEIANAGMTHVRVPVCFGAWASIEEPYRWDFAENIPMVDSIIAWALQRNLKVLIDLHHTEFDGSIPNAATTKRLVWLWSEIANRYKNLDPEKVFFELRNEPHDIPAETWRLQAQELINTVRKIAPNHTLVVGAEDWNGLDALVKMKPFDDKNIIYTFHFYDPFIFTHQGATWAGDGLSDLRGITFPATGTVTIPEKAVGKWVEKSIKNYVNDGTSEALINRLKKIKQWSVDNKVPIFCGEFGSYNKVSDKDSRCRHAQIIFRTLGSLEIPASWWEWDGGFKMLDNSNTLIPCMKEAIAEYKTK
jgi:endoglucanase